VFYETIHINHQFKKQRCYFDESKKMSVAYDWNSQDFNEEITTHDPEKSYYDSQVFEKEII
jgi:hypothetical protein